TDFSFTAKAVVCHSITNEVPEILLSIGVVVLTPTLFRTTLIFLSGLSYVAFMLNLNCFPASKYPPAIIQSEQLPLNNSTLGISVSTVSFFSVVSVSNLQEPSSFLALEL